MDKRQRLTVDIDESLFQDVKVYCAINKLTMKDYVVNLIKKDMSKKKK